MNKTGLNWQDVLAAKLLIESFTDGVVTNDDSCDDGDSYSITVTYSCGLNDTLSTPESVFNFVRNRLACLEDDPNFNDKWKRLSTEQAKAFIKYQATL